MTALVRTAPAVVARVEVSAVARCWKHDGGVLVPNELPIHLELGGQPVDLRVETARQLIAQLTDAVGRAEDVQAILDGPAGAAR